MNPGTPSSLEASKNGLRALVLCGLLLAATLIAYGRVWGLGFIGYDDPGYVQENRHVLAGLSWSGIAWAFTTTTEANWHPLTWLSLMLDASIGGANPTVFHATNLLLHVANTLLLFLLLDRMTGFRGRSAFVAALFAVHPLHVESVAWIAERKDVLSTLFWLLTMAAYVRYAARPSLGRYALVLAPFALGLLAKPMLVTLPLVLLLLDVWPLGRWAASEARSMSRTFGGARVRLVFEKVPLLALAGASSLATILAQREALQPLGSFPLAGRISNALVAYAAYIGKMIWPQWLSIFYQYPRQARPLWEPAGAALLLAAVSVGAIRLRHKRPWLFTGWFWYVVTLVPVIGIVQVGSQAMADRYTYVPLIGLFIVVAWGVPELMRLDLPRSSAAAPARADRSEDRKAARSAGIDRSAGLLRLLPAGAIAIVLVLMAFTWFQVDHWRSTVALFSHAIEATTDNAVAHNILAAALEKEGDADRSLWHLREALRIAPGFADAHYELTRALLRRKQLDEAAALCLEEQTAWPSDERTLVDLGLLAMVQGRFDEAASRFTEVLGKNHDSVDAHLNLSAVRNAQGRTMEMLTHYADVVRLIGPEKAQELSRRAAAMRPAGPSGP